MERTILHSDLNCFFAAVEMVLHPELQGKPVAVCGSVENRHGIVLTKSQLAKEAGVKTGMAVWQAKQLCVGLIIVEPHHNKYQEYSEKVREIYGQYTDRVEPFGIDEAWIDVTGCTHLFGDGKHIADEIRERVKTELGLTVSVGVSFNKVFAKLGSDMKKPDATTVISREDYKRIVWPLPASELLFVGRATQRRLHSYGIETIGDLANSNPEDLQFWFGKCGLVLWQYANGLDCARVHETGFSVPAKSVGHGLTFMADLVSNAEVEKAFLLLAQSVSRKLRETNVAAMGVSIFVRTNELYWQQYQTRLKAPTQSFRDMARTAYELFLSKYDWKKPIRTLTVTAIRLIPADAPRQVEMFFDYDAFDRRERLEKSVFSIRERFGKCAIDIAGLMNEKKLHGTKVEERTELPDIISQ